MKSKIIMLIFFIVLALPLALAGTVERSFSDNDVNPLAIITTSLDVTIDDAIVYSISEFVPAGWTIIDEGSGTIQPNGDEIRWIEFSPEDTILEYIIQAPASGGSYFFDGTAVFDDNPEQDIIGETQVTVSGDDTTPPIITNIQASPSQTTAVITWTTNENADSKVFYGETENLGSEESESSRVTSHSIILENLNENTFYYYKVESCDSSNNCDDSIILSFTTLETDQDPTDDLMVNYVRGIIMIDDSPAVAGTGYQVEVLSGANQGATFQGTVDSNIPGELQGNGYYDSLDRIEFQTGASFRVSLLGYICLDGDEEGIFENGGNGDFNTQEGLVNIDCIVSQNSAPVLEDIPDQVMFEDETTSVMLFATDPDQDQIFFNVINEDINKVDCDLDGNILFFNPFPDWNGETTCEIEINDGVLTDSKIVNIEVLPLNDAPEFIGTIADITWNQDTDLINFLDLNDFFIDPDMDDLVFVSIGNQNIDITIENGIVSFFPDDGFWGTRNIFFEAADSEFFTLSNAIVLTVTKDGDPPIFGELDCNTVIDEDTGYSCDLVATDPDNDEFTFSIVSEDNLDCTIIDEDTLNYVSAQDYNGPASCLIKVEDVDGFNEFLLEVNVLPINDAPVLDPIPDIIENEGALIEINAHATDVDNDPLTYSIDGSRFTNHGDGRFTWQTTFDDSGIYFFEITVDDGHGGIDNQIVQILLEDINEPPIFNSIPDVEILEDSGFQIVVEDLTIFAHDNDGSIDRFEVISENINEVDCSIEGISLGVNPALDFSGQTSCMIRVYDNDGDSDETTLDINVLDVNDAPVIDSFLPIFNPILTEDGFQDFTIIWSDSDNPEDVSIEWFVDDNLEDIGDNYQFTATNTGQFNIEVIVSDSLDFVSYIWNLIVSNIPIVDSYSGGTTDFSGMDDDDLSSVDLILEKENGKIEFLESVDLRDTVDFENFADILNSLVAIDTDHLIALDNIPAKITLSNLNFDEMPTIYHNDGFTLDPDEVIDVCPLSVCSNRDYDSSTGTLFFEVSGFSTFRAGDVLSCSQQGGNICASDEICDGELISATEGSCCSTTCSDRPLEFNDINRCELENLNTGIEIDIKEPDKGDDFEPEEIIEVDIRIENNLDEDLDFDIDVFLYDTDREDVVEDDDDSMEIDESDSERIDFNIRIPADIDDTNDYAIFVKVEDDKGEFCNEEFVFIDIDREEHDVIVDSMFIQPDVSICRESISVEVNLRNIGSKDEDVYLKLENFQLGISERTGTFEIEEFDEDDTAQLSFNYRIPEDAGAGLYEIKATVVFDDGREENSLIKVLSLGTCSDFRGELITNGPIKLGDPITDKAVKETSSTSKFLSSFSTSGLSKLSVINIVLILGIVLIIIILIVVAIPRRR